MTKRTECGNLIESAARPARDNLERAANERASKKFEKTWKKFLTKRKRCVIIKTRRDKFARCAPCKLNNVTNTKHQKGDGCLRSFKKACKEQRQFISLKLSLSFNKIDLRNFGSLNTILLRVWSWLRMNAGGVLNTCKSNGEPLKEDSSNWYGFLVADGWVTRE